MVWCGLNILIFMWMLICFVRGVRKFCGFYLWWVWCGMMFLLNLV